MVVDADSTVRYVSPSVEGVFGYDPEELEGTQLTLLIPEDKDEGAPVPHAERTGRRDLDRSHRIEDAASR